MSQAVSVVRDLGARIVTLVVVGCSGAVAPPVTAQPVEPVAAPVAAEVDAGPSLDDLRIAAIAKVVNETNGARHDCWAIGAADDYQLAGRVVLEVGFADGGAVDHVVVVEDATGDRALTRCLTELYEQHPWPPVFAAATAVRVPFTFLAPSGQYTVQRDHVEVNRLAGGKLSAQVLLGARNTGNPAVGISALTVSGGLDVALHRHGATEIIYVLSGEAIAYDLAGFANGRRVGPGDAIYAAAGTAHGLRHTGEVELELLNLYAPGGAEQRFAGREDPGTSPVSDREQRRPGRNFARPRFASLSGIAPLVLAGGTGRVVIGFDAASAGDPAAYLGRLEFDPGAEVASHQHATETELLYVTAGGGVLAVAGVDYPIGSGDAIQLPPGVEHSLVVGDTGLAAVHSYAPSGPEQRFQGM